MSGVKSIGFHLFGMILQNATMLVTGIYVARMIGAADYGTSTVLRSLFQIVSIVSPLGLELFLQKYVGSHPDDVGTTRVVATRLRLVAFTLGLAVFVGLFAGGSTWLDDHVYRIPGFDWLLTLTFAALPFQSDIAILGGIYRGRFNPTPQIAMSFYLLPLARLGLLVLLLGLGYGLTGVVVATTASVFVSAVLLNLHYRFRQDRDVPAPEGAARPSWPETLKMLEPALWMAASLFLYGSIRAIDVIVLGLFRTTKEIGEYGATSTIAQFVQFFPHALSQTLGPAVAMLFTAGNLAGVRDALDRNLRLASLMAAPIFAGVAVWGTGMDVLFGRSFQFSPGVSFGLALGYYVSGVTGATGFALSMTGRHRAESAVLLMGNLVALGGCLALVPLFGQIGAAIGSCFAYLAINFVRTLVARSVIGGIPGSLRDLWPPILAFALGQVVYRSGEALLPHGVVTFFVSGIVFVSIYAALAWVLFLDEDEKAFVTRRLERVMRRR